MKSFTSLEALHQYFHTHNTCALKHTATQPVFGVGTIEKRIMCIGEAPGKNEDIQGIPFIGAAGKVLNELLASIKLKREDIYITNTVKYRPPDNRDPLPEEKEACKAWLYHEIMFIQPVLIVVLGRHAMHTFFPEAAISGVHGKVLTKSIPTVGTYSFLVLYHPAAAIYNRSLRETLFQDVAQIPLILSASSDI